MCLSEICSLYMLHSTVLLLFFVYILGVRSLCPVEDCVQLFRRLFVKGP